MKCLLSTYSVIVFFALSFTTQTREIRTRASARKQGTVGNSTSESDAVALSRKSTVKSGRIKTKKSTHVYVEDDIDKKNKLGSVSI